MYWRHIDHIVIKYEYNLILKYYLMLEYWNNFVQNSLNIDIVKCESNIDAILIKYEQNAKSKLF